MYGDATMLLLDLLFDQLRLVICNTVIFVLYTQDQAVLRREIVRREWENWQVSYTILAILSLNTLISKVAKGRIWLRPLLCLKLLQVLLRDVPPMKTLVMSQKQSLSNASTFVFFGFTKL